MKPSSRKILWTAKDGGVELEEAKAVMLSVWDSKAKESLYRFVDKRNAS
jgi:hypothetical protein